MFLLCDNAFQFAMIDGGPGVTGWWPFIQVELTAVYLLDLALFSWDAILWGILNNPRAIWPITEGELIGSLFCFWAIEETKEGCLGAGVCSYPCLSCLGVTKWYNFGVLLFSLPLTNELLQVESQGIPLSFWDSPLKRLTPAFLLYFGLLAETFFLEGHFNWPVVGLGRAHKGDESFVFSVVSTFDIVVLQKKLSWWVRIEFVWVNCCFEYYWSIMMLLVNLERVFPAPFLKTLV